MGKRHGTGGKNHEDAKHSFNVFGAIDVSLDLGHTSQQQRTKRCHSGTDKSRNDHRIGKFRAHTHVYIQSDMLQAFQQGDHADHEANQKHIHRDISHGTLKRVLMLKNEPLYGYEQSEGDGASQKGRHHPAHSDRAYLAPRNRVDGDADRSESDDGTNDGVRCGNGPASLTGNRQPRCSSEQRSEHAVNKQLRRVGQQFRINYALANC